LHAATLGFIHPTTEAMMRFDSPLPLDMEAAITKWKNYKAAAHT
jgi:23S rRNA pseudouridine1911/1915/1917 synthase